MRAGTRWCGEQRPESEVRKLRRPTPFWGGGPGSRLRAGTAQGYVIVYSTLELAAPTVAAPVATYSA